MSIFAALRNDKGTTSVEYAVVAMGIFLAIVTTVFVLGGRVTEFYESIVAAFS